MLLSLSISFHLVIISVLNELELFATTINQI